jgi:indole-3-glycerol phosphate synthase
MTGVLGRILEAKRTEIAALRVRRLPPSTGQPRPITLHRAAGDALRLLAEIKLRSPSAGPLSTRLGVGERAAVYERGGAAMVSVLTDGEFFAGSFSHLTEARAACSLPLLCKDFVLDEVQLDAARAYGADAVLVIVRCVSPARVATLVAEARARDLEPLVEVASDAEARLALDAGARLIGVNARDLDTLEMDPERAERVLHAIPESVVAIHLSGLRTAEDVARVARSRADAALIGETLMRQDDPEPLLRSMAAAARPG